MRPQERGCPVLAAVGICDFLSAVAEWGELICHVAHVLGFAVWQHRQVCPPASIVCYGISVLLLSN